MSCVGDDYPSGSVRCQHCLFTFIYLLITRIDRIDFLIQIKTEGWIFEDNSVEKLHYKGNYLSSTASLFRLPSNFLDVLHQAPSYPINRIP